MTCTPSQLSFPFQTEDPRLLRQYRGVTIEDIAERTKISPQYLRAIEDENYSSLPGGVFNVSYIRQYASAIGFDASRLLQRYHEKTGSNHPAEHSSLNHGRQKQIPPLRWLRSLAGLH